MKRQLHYYRKIPSKFILTALLFSFFTGNLFANRGVNESDLNEYNKVFPELKSKLDKSTGSPPNDLFDVTVSGTVTDQ